MISIHIAYYIQNMIPPSIRQIIININVCPSPFLLYFDSIRSVVWVASQRYFPRAAYCVYTCTVLVCPSSFYPFFAELYNSDFVFQRWPFWIFFLYVPGTQSRHCVQLSSSICCINLLYRLHLTCFMFC